MGNKRINILITAASRRVALIRSFQKALEETATEGAVIVTDTDPLSPGLFFCEKYHLAPLSTSPDYVARIMDICVKENVSLLVPTIDEELPIFGKHKADFERNGVIIPVSSEAIGNICNDKYQTYLFMKEHGMPMVQTWLPDEVLKEKPSPPLFIKPRMGRGAVKAFPINSMKELEFFLEYVSNPVIQRYLPGREFTIDVLSDFNGKVISVVPRERLVIRSGVTDRGRTCKNRKMMDLAAEISSKLGLVGPSNLQCKVNGDEITFFEINPRFSGAIQLTISSGANFPKMILEMMNGGVAPCIGDFEDNLTMSSYEESIYQRLLRS